MTAFYRKCKRVEWCVARDVPCTRWVKDVVAGTDCVSAQAAEKPPPGQGGGEKMGFRRISVVWRVDFAANEAW